MKSKETAHVEYMMNIQPTVIKWSSDKLEVDREVVPLDQKEVAENDVDPDDPPPIMPQTERFDSNASNTVCFNVKIKLDRGNKAHSQPKVAEGVQRIKADPNAITSKKKSTNDGEKQHHKCNLCTKTFSTRQHLARHANLHSMETLYPCHQCDKVLLDRSYLLRHLKTHETKKDYTCTICQRQFRTICNLKRHLTTHNPDLRSHVCSECGKRFPDTSSLKKHSISHSGARTHICTICAKGFSHVGDLNIHLKSHDLEKQFSCDECGKKFSRHNNLVRHQAIHSPNGDFKCGFCNVCFQHAATLTRHLLSFHPKESRRKKHELSSAGIEVIEVQRTTRGEFIEVQRTTNRDFVESTEMNMSNAQDPQTELNASGTAQQIALVPTSPSSFEIYRIDESGSLIRINDIQSAQLLNSARLGQTPSGIFQWNSFNN